jgi:hypothetical protein
MKMKDLHEFRFTNHIIVQDNDVPVDVYVSTPDGISIIKVKISNDMLETVDCDCILNKFGKLHTLIYPYVESLSYQVDIFITDETIEADEGYLVFKFYGVRGNQ